LVLLGDETNRRFVPAGAEFHPFSQFEHSEKFRTFLDVFHVIQGSRHRFKKHGGTERWLQFVFARWFFIEAFVAQEGLDAFWTFDSDTLVLASLARRESRFADVDATTQCRNRCLNGWIGSLSLVQRYTACIVQLFSNQDYLDYQRKRLEEQAGLAFNEMDAFEEFRARESVKTLHAADVRNGEAFDDALGFPEGFEVSPEAIVSNLRVKQLWTTREGGIFARTTGSGEMVRLLTCNMSWMPDYLTRRFAGMGSVPEGFAPGDFRKISLFPTPVERLRRKWEDVTRAWVPWRSPS
jgi:hypothetical protein